MKITYVSSAMDEEDFEALFCGSAHVPGQQAQKYNRLLIEGFAQNQVKVNAISSRPVNRRNCKALLIGKSVRRRDLITYVYHGLINLPVLKNLFLFLSVFFLVIKDSKKRDNAIVTDVLNATASLAASCAARLKKRPCIGIVTDMPELMVTGSSAKFCKMVHKTVSRCTGYVFLTEAINEAINLDRKPYVIIEGLCDFRQALDNLEKKDSSVKKILYAGLLDARYGVKMLVEGFLAAQIPDAQLHLYGAGSYAGELAKIAETHENVQYHGVVMNREIVKAEKEADLLVNPRPTGESFVKFSFPSKNLEYMISGTPMLTTTLPGMPTEYHPYVFLLEEESVSGFSDKLREIFSLPEEARLKKGRDARLFVSSEKNNVVQAKKVLDLAASFK